MNKLTGIIFDFNGTLFWDGSLHETAWNKMAIKLTGKKLSDSELAHHMHGKTNRSIIEYILGHKVSENEKHEIANEKEALYRQACLENKEIFKFADGVEKFLNTLHNRNIPMGIATSSDKDNVDFFIEHFQLFKWFSSDTIIFNNGTFPGKPEPDIFIHAAHKIGVPLTNCIVFEDAPSGIIAAHDAGIGTIIAVASNPVFEESAYQKTHRIIHSFEEININQLLN